MTITLISLIVGLVVGWLITYAVTFRSSQNWVLGLSIVGALIGGALVPALLSWGSVIVAIIGALVGIAVALLIYARVARSS